MWSPLYIPKEPLEGLPVCPIVEPLEEPLVGPIVKPLVEHLEPLVEPLVRSLVETFELVTRSPSPEEYLVVPLVHTLM